jgi:hypothetical protein
MYVGFLQSGLPQNTSSERWICRSFATVVAQLLSVASVFVSSPAAMAEKIECPICKDEMITGDMIDEDCS